MEKDTRKGKSGSLSNKEFLSQMAANLVMLTYISKILPIFLEVLGYM